MSSSRREAAPRQVPPPPNSRADSPYTRFIPREELGEVASWAMGRFDTPAPPRTVFVAGRDALPAAAQAAAATAGAPPSPAPDPQALAEAQAQAREAALEAAMRAVLEAEYDERLRTETAAQVHAARQQGYQDGYRDGLVALDSFKQSYAQQVSAQVGSVLQSLDDELRTLEQQAGASVARVATELARQVVRSELVTRPALVAQVAQEAVNSVLLSARHITVHLHPDDQALVAQGAADVLAGRGARLQASAGIARGGCRIDSDAGTIDARISMRWAQATQALGTGVSWSDAAEPGADA